MDRKSSRGMIYENEELRLRTININAEVERGQSDIRKLRRENEQLRREIWSLRDEYDRLNKRFKANKYLPDSISEHAHSGSSSDDSDSCDRCREEPEINDQCLLDHEHDYGNKQNDHFSSFSSRQQVLNYDNYPQEELSFRSNCINEQRNSSSLPGIGEAAATSATSSAAPSTTTIPDYADSNDPSKHPSDNLHVNFDHLSIVSEENLSNSDGNITQQLPNTAHNYCHQAHQQIKQTHPCFYYDENFIEIDGARLSPSQCLGAMSLPDTALHRPVTPIEMVANQLNDLKSIVPPLSYFENIVQQHMGTTISDSCTSTNTGDTAIPTNGWDYNIESPFLQSKFHSSNNSSPSSNSKTRLKTSNNVSIPNRSVEKTQQSSIASVVSTPSNSNESSDGTYKNLKHFFSPIKPRLKLDTTLATTVASSSSSYPLAGSISASSIPLPPPPPLQYFERLHHLQTCDPPDIYVTNALASPYYPQSMSGTSLPSLLMPAVTQSEFSVMQQSHNESIHETAQTKSQTSGQSLANTKENFKNSGNLQQIINEIGTISEDILHMQLNKSKSQEKLNTDHQSFHKCSTGLSACACTTSTSQTATSYKQALPSLCSPNSNVSKAPNPNNHKPYRSEMNLLLSYKGTNPVIIPLAKNTSNNDTNLNKNDNGNDNDNITAGGCISTKSDIERDSNSPSPPQLPTPMAPLPANLMYLGFDKLNQSVGRVTTVSLSPQFPPSSPLKLDEVSQLNTQRQVSLISQKLPSPPAAAAPDHTETPTATFAGAVDDNKFLPADVSGVLRISGEQDTFLNPVLAISSPDLSTTPLATIAPLKRRIFSRQKEDETTSQITRSFDAADVSSARYGNDITEKQSKPLQQQTEVSFADDVKGSSNEINNYESSSGSEPTKRKSSRRVSIVCHEEKDGEKCAQPDNTEDKKQQQQQADKFENLMPSIVVNLKHSNSTPNSPHSTNRRCGGNTNSALSVNSGASSSLHHHGHHHHHHHHHHHNRKLSQESVAVPEVRFPTLANSSVNSNPDNVSAATIASPSQLTARYKCSRRHSEGTVSSVVGGNANSIPAVDGGCTRLSTSTAAGGHNHHHHHHHHQDSNQETATSLSERNSASLSSSRDSSTSLSMRSQRRKISVSSHTGGKIPWCGCWGNGCL